MAALGAWLRWAVTPVDLAYRIGARPGGTAADHRTPRAPRWLRLAGHLAFRPLALLAVITPLMRAAQHSPQIAWGDVATWALFVGAFAAALVALRQLRIQQKDSERRTTQLERQQADKVDHTWCPKRSVLILSTKPFRLGTEDGAVVMVMNNSPRPIRDVTSRIELADGTTLDPILLGVTVEADESAFDYQLYNPRQGTLVPLIRPEFKYGFFFDFTIPDDDAAHPEERTSHPFIRFTDDVGLMWEIDDDLRLRPMRLPREPWYGVMGPPDPL